MAEAIVTARPEIVYKAYEEVELKVRISDVRVKWLEDKSEDFTKSFLDLLDFLED